MTPTDVGTMMPLTSGEESISSLQRTRRPRIRSGRSLRSLGSPLNAQPLDGRSQIAACLVTAIAVMCAASCTTRTQTVPEPTPLSPTPQIPPSLTVLVSDEDGVTIPGVTVVAYRAEGSLAETARAATDVRGKAVFRNLNDGLYEVRSELSPFCQDRAVRAAVAQNSAADVRVTMTMRWTRCDFTPIPLPTPSLPVIRRLPVPRTPSSGNPL